MMILVYTEKLEYAAMMAAALGGIHSSGKIIRSSDLERYKDQVYEEANAFCFIKSSIGGSDAAFIWGDGLISVDRPSSAPFTKDALFPSKLRYTLTDDIHSKRFMDILALPDHRLIYDASLGSGGILPLAFDMLELSKDVARVIANSLNPEDIKSAFESPASINESRRILFEEITSNYLSYYEESALKILGLDISKEELIILSLLGERKCLEEDRKKSFEVSLTVGPLSLKGKDALFGSEDEAKDFILGLPKTAKVSVKSGKASYYPLGPHSTSSLIKAASLRFHYAAAKVSLTLNSLYEKGYVTSKSSEARTISNEQIKAAKEAALMLTSYPNFIAANVKGNLLDEIDERHISKSRECAILPTPKRPGRDMTESERHIYTLISEELIRCFLGKNEVVRKTVSIALCGKTFTGHIQEVITPGFTLLDDSPAPSLSINDGDELEIIPHISEAMTQRISPYTESELQRVFPYSEEPIKRLLDFGFIRKNRNYIVLTDSGVLAFERIKAVPGIKETLIGFENRLSYISRSSSDEEAISVKKELLKDAVNVFISWINMSGRRLSKSDYICPVCKKELSETGSRLSCSCGFSLGKQYFGYRMTDEDIKSILNSKHSGIINNLKSSSGSFSGVFYIDSSNEIKCICIEENISDMI